MSAPQNMAATATLEVAGRPVTVREVTLGELRALLARQAAEADGYRDLLEVLLIEGWDLAEMALFCDLTTEELGALRPGEVRQVLGAIERMNADFFAFRARLRRLAEAPAPPAPSLSAPSPT